MQVENMTDLLGKFWTEKNHWIIRKHPERQVISADKTKFECTICGMRFTDRSNQRRHIRRQHELRCTVCDEKFDNKVICVSITSGLGPRWRICLFILRDLSTDRVTKACELKKRILPSDIIFHLGTKPVPLWRSSCPSHLISSDPYRRVPHSVVIGTTVKSQIVALLFITPNLSITESVRGAHLGGARDATTSVNCSKIDRQSRTKRAKPRPFHQHPLGNLAVRALV